MHVLKNSAPIPMLGMDRVLEPGEWITQDQTAFELGLMAPRGTAAINRYDASPWKDAFHDGMSVAIVRSGAIGDLLFLTPALREFRKCHPKSRIGLSCFQKHHALFQDTAHALCDDLLEYPLRLDYGHQFQRFASLENVVELAKDRHATDAFADALGVKVEDYRPVYKVSDQEWAAALNAFPRTGKTKRIALHLRASTRNRDYPFHKWAEVILTMAKRGHDVFLFGSKGQIPPFQVPAGYAGMVTDTTHLSFREAGALLSTCNAFAGVDSSFLHLCHALDIPCVGIFAAFPWETRTSHNPKALALTSQEPNECAPCHWMATAGHHFPPNMPCSKSGYCTVLASIEPARIVKKIEDVL